MNAIQLELFKRSDYEILHDQIILLQKQSENVRRALFFRVNELEKTILDQEKQIRMLNDAVELLSEECKTTLQ